MQFLSTEKNIRHTKFYLFKLVSKCWRNSEETSTKVEYYKTEKNKSNVNARCSGLKKARISRASYLKKPPQEGLDTLPFLTGDRHLHLVRHQQHAPIFPKEAFDKMGIYEMRLMWPDKAVRTQQLIKFFECFTDQSGLAIL